MAKHMVSGSSKMAWAIEGILVPHRLTVLGPEVRALMDMPAVPDLELIPINHYVTIENRPYMPLTIHRASRGVIEVAHFCKHEIAPGMYEDLPDPRGMYSTFWPLLGFVPMRLEQRVMLGSGMAATDADFDTGRIFYFNPQQMGGQVRFANMWARNLIAHGFAGSKRISYSWAEVSVDTCAEATLG